MDENVTLEMYPDPDWSEADQLQLLRLLFGPRRDQATTQVPADHGPCTVNSQLGGQQSPDK